jgi:hypothetical protein
MGLYLPSVAVFHPVYDGIMVRSTIAGIAVDTAVGGSADRLVDLRWREKLHVGYPHGEAVIRRHPVPLFHAVPLEALGIPPVDGSVEVIIHGVLLLQGR